MQSPQIHLFDETKSGPKAYQTATKAATKRIFLYDGQQFEDPGPEFTTQDVLDALAQTYPALANGTWTSRTLPDGDSGEIEEITFVKVTGEKGSQANFFDGQNNGDLPLLPGPTVQKTARRVFLYDGQVFEDPGPEFTIQDVLDFLAQTYPALANGTWTSRTVPDGASGEVEEITFVKVTGEKGVCNGD